MKLKRKSLILLLLIIFNCSLKGQSSSDNIELNQVILKDSILISIVDSFLTTEQYCYYYTDSLYLIINCFDWNQNINKESNNNDTIMITIESLSRRDILLGFNDIAYFNFNNHLCIVQGAFPPELFSLTQKKTNFGFLNHEINDRAVPSKAINLINDDSHSIWAYSYSKGEFRFVDGTPICPR